MTRSRLATSLVLVVAVVMATPSWAYREAFTPEQREKLQNIQTVFVDVIALTDTGAVDPGPMTQIVASRMEQMGYTVVTKSSDPYDAVLKVKCEQSKTWEGTTRFGSDFDLPDSPSRVWKGPACQFNYLLDGTKILWQKEVRTEFQDSIQAATEAGADNPGAYALRQLTQSLRSHEYPLLLAAEWGHPDRLIAVLDDPAAHELQKLKAISLLGEMLAEKAVPRLKEALKNKDLAQQAAVALGNVGKESIPILLDMLKNSKDPGLQAAAAKGIGQVGALHGDYSAVPVLLDMLEAPDVTRQVQTEIAWSLGKMPDKRAIKPLRAFDSKLLQIRAPEDKELQKLKEAVFWALKQVDMSDHMEGGSF